MLSSKRCLEALGFGVDTTDRFVPPETKPSFSGAVIDSREDPFSGDRFGVTWTWLKRLVCDASRWGLCFAVLTS